MALFIHVLRIKCERFAQSDLFRSSVAPIDIIRQAISAKPTADVGRGIDWHIGNVKEIGGDAISFAMGRAQPIRIQQFDDTTHDFLEADIITAPFTIAVFDFSNQVCGIIRKSGVSLSAEQVAKKLSILLNSTRFPREANAVISVEPIWDPQDFITSIKSSYAVLRFSFTVTRPNPIDVERLIQAPAKEFTNRIDGVRTKVETEGPSLDPDVIEEVVHAVAADGEIAAATIRTEKGKPSRRLRSSGSPLVEEVNQEVDTSLINSILASARMAYGRVRHGSSSDG